VCDDSLFSSWCRSSHKRINYAAAVHQEPLLRKRFSTRLLSHRNSFLTQQHSTPYVCNLVLSHEHKHE
jgi:hypothetical protein